MFYICTEIIVVQVFRSMKRSAQYAVVGFLAQFFRFQFNSFGYVFAKKNNILLRIHFRFCSHYPLAEYIIHSHDDTLNDCSDHWSLVLFGIAIYDYDWDIFIIIVFVDVSPRSEYLCRWLLAKVSKVKWLGHSIHSRFCMYPVRFTQSTLNSSFGPIVKLPVFVSVSVNYPVEWGKWRSFCCLLSVCPFTVRCPVFLRIRQCLCMCVC